MNKTYKIKTLQDIIDCTNKDNLHMFLEDLKLMIQGIHELEPHQKQLVDGEMQWVDDGVNQGIITLEPTPKI